MWPEEMVPDDFWESIFADISNKVWKNLIDVGTDFGK